MYTMRNSLIRILYRYSLCDFLWLFVIYTIWHKKVCENLNTDVINIFLKFVYWDSIFSNHSFSFSVVDTIT